MRGIAKINKKLGPLGSIALAIAMPYALSGLSSGVTALQGSQSTFLKAIGNIGNQIRGGYQAFNAGVSKTFSSITNSIAKGFRKFSPKGLQNSFSEISRGAKNLFNSAKNTVKKYTPKFRTAKAGTVEVYGVGDPGVSVISSTDAASAIQKGTLEASQLGKQTLTQPGGFFTRTNVTGMKSDDLVTETINNAYKNRLDGFGPNAQTMFRDSVTRAKELGTYINDEEIGSFIENNAATTRYSVKDVVGDTDLYGTGKYNVKTEIGNLVDTGDYIEMPNGGYQYTGNKTFSAEPIKNTTNQLSKAIKKSATGFLKDSLLKPMDKIDPYYMGKQDMTFETSTSGYSGTDITGTSGGDLFANVYGDAAANRLKNMYKNMNLLYDY
jgi:hypothetical protein